MNHDHEDFCASQVAEMREFFGLPDPWENGWGANLPEENAPCRGVREAHALAHGWLHTLLKASEQDMVSALRLCRQAVNR
jgi:hypothetical protein